MKKLNKKNMLEFADYLYKETKDSKGNIYIDYVPMCSMKIADIDNNEVVCCAVGEMYVFFMEELPYTLKSFAYSPQYYTDYITTSTAVERLEEITETNAPEEIFNHLYSLSEINDKTMFVKDNDVLIERAKRCSKYCRQIAKKYLI